jgi:hypothetical protein
MVVFSVRESGDASHLSWRIQEWMNMKIANSRESVIDQGDRAFPISACLPCQEQHFPAAYWAQLWGFSVKTVREWFRDESGPGILRQPNIGRRSKRDYTTVMIAPSAAARVYGKRSAKVLIH